MKRISLIIFVSVWFSVCKAQGTFDENLTTNRWSTDSSISGLNFWNFKQIGLSKLRTPFDSIKENRTIWTFKESEILIQKFTLENGLEADTIKVAYVYKNGEMTIYHFAQDAYSWKYNIGITSTSNFILLIKKKEKP